MFLQLTLTVGGRVFVNVNHLAFFVENSQPGEAAKRTSRVQVGDGPIWQELVVSETVEEICSKLADLDVQT